MNSKCPSLPRTAWTATVARAEPITLKFHPGWFDPTSQPLPIAAASIAPASTAARFCPTLLTELLALNEEMIVQLHAERLSGSGTEGFMLRMIAQHERAATLLRIKLELPWPTIV